jgi:hypothetical protein
VAETSLTNQNRVSSNIDFPDFAARLRRFIHASLDGVPADSFESLALDLFALQFSTNPPYRRFCEVRGSRPETVNHWSAVPAVPASAFKDLVFSCLPIEARTAVFHSSGTTEHRPSRHFHGSESLPMYEASLWAWFAESFQPLRSGLRTGKSQAIAHDQMSLADWQLVNLTPPPADAPRSSLVHMFDVIRSKLGLPESVFVGEAAADGWTLNHKAAIELLDEASSTDRPVVIMGTAFSFVHLLDHLDESGLHFHLPAGSCALETGGYKGRSRALPKTELHEMITWQLGVPSSRIVCEYGMSELSSQAYDLQITGWASGTAKRRFRFPPWARVQILSPETSREASEGEAGLIRVFDLANVYSVMAVQTEDLAVRRANGFELVGRTTPAEARGCSLMPVAP